MFTETDPFATRKAALLAALGRTTQPLPTVTGPALPTSPDAASNGGINPGGTSAGSILGGAPAPPAQPGQYANMLHGFDPGKLAAGKNDPKYNFGAIAKDYAPTPEGLAQAVQDPRFAGTGDTYLGGDKIRVPNGSVIDVGEAFGSGGGQGWAWQPVSGPDAASAAPTTGGAGLPPALSALLGGGLPGLSPILQGNANDGITQALQNVGGIGANASSMLQQLIAALGGGG